MRLATYRRTSQVTFLVLTLSGILFGLSTTGIIYPYFFCYSCPWDVGACPIGILEHSVIDIQISGLFWTGMAMLAFLIGFMVLMGLLFGRGFCGWGCPVGALQDVTRKTGIGKLLNKKIGGEIDHRVKYIKYIILILIAPLSYYTQDLFYTMFCPVGGITGTVPTLTFYFSEWTLGTTFPIKITSIVLFVILILLVVRGWCKYLCPVGAFLAPLNYRSAVNLTRNEETCTDCNLCERTCPMDVKEMGRHEDAECILCGRCVDVCRHNSLKLGSRFAKGRMAGFLPWILVVILASGLMVAGAYYSGYERVDAINAIPCLGCLALDPVSPEEWFYSDADTIKDDGRGNHQDFVMDTLDHSPVFLHYRTIVCAACDEMEPYIEELEEEYGSQIKFIHINLDLAPEDEVDSYYDYDVLGTPDNTAGVPLFAIVTLNETTEGNVPVFKSVYGSSSDGGISKMGDLEVVIEEAVARYQEAAGPIAIVDSGKMPLVELFVDMNCVWCPSSEDALVELEEEGIANYITYTTDAPTVSGSISRDTEAYYQDLLGGGGGHPWAIFNGGPEENLGGGGGIKAQYVQDISASGFSTGNISIDGEMIEASGSLHTGITLTNPDNASQSILVKAFLVEQVSRFPNIQDDPIPNAFIDLIVNQTYDIAGGSSENINVTWAGMDALAYDDFRLGNLAIIVTAWDDDGALVNSKHIEADVEDALLWEVDKDAKAVQPNSTASFDLTLQNYLDTDLVVNITSALPAKWSTDLPSNNFTVPTMGTAGITLDVSNVNTSIGDILEFKVRAQGVYDSTIDISQKLTLLVKDDILPPTIASISHTPAEPGSTDEVDISAVIGDASPLKSVEVLYYSCTDEVCSATFKLNMTTSDGNNYEASVMAIEDIHNILHYKIIAEDEAGNVIESEWQDVDLIPVSEDEGHDTGGDKSTFNTLGMAGLLIFAMVAIGLNIARIKQNPKKKVEKKEDDDDEISKEPDAEPTSDEE